METPLLSYGVILTGSLETFLRGMETKEHAYCTKKYQDLETFLRGMETAEISFRTAFAVSLETFLRGMETIPYPTQRHVNTAP